MAREYIDPAELRVINTTMYANAAGSINTTYVRKSVSGKGGSVSVRYGSGSGIAYLIGRPFESGRYLQEGYIKMGIYPQAVAGFGWRDSATAYKGFVERNTPAVDQLNLVVIKNNVGTVLATATGTVASFRWSLLEAHVRSASSADSHTGYIAVFVDDDGNYSTPFVDYTGDNVASGLSSLFNQVGAHGNTYATFDDGPDINSITLLYDGGAGSFAPSPGDTITDGGSGATAVVTAVEGDTTSGRLILQQWNGTAFVNNNTITESGGSTTAAVNAPTADFVNGFEPNSYFIGNEFVIISQPEIDRAGAYSQLSQSEVVTYNSELVDGVPYTDTDYVYTNTAGQKDSYHYGDTTNADLPSNIVIGAIATMTVGMSDDGGITNIEHTLRQGTVDYPSGIDISLSGTHVMQQQIWQTQPNGSGVWTRAALADTNFEAGAILKA